MKVLQLCPLWFPISRDAPGGIETFLAQLIPALDSLGCQITYVASGDSDVKANLWPVMGENLYNQMKAGIARYYSIYEQRQLQIAVDNAADFDLIHSHVGPGAYLLSLLPGLRDRVLHTVHKPVYADLQWFVHQSPEIWFSTVSEFQARSLREHGARHCCVIPNGIDAGAFSFKQDGDKSLLFLGRIEQEKGPDIAVKTAQQLGQALILAGPIVQHEFFKHLIEPSLNDKIQYVGAVDHGRKNRLLGSAACVLMPSRDAEPFGLVALEAMACGTPVVALANGALPEIIEPGLTGYLGVDEQSLPTLVTHAMRLDRAAIRDRVAARFGISPVAKRYLQLYEQILNYRQASACRSAVRS
jgi:glycosyltransferase involved in cell wall biosynthesis